MVALTGVEPAVRQFSSVQLGLSGCRFSTVGIPGCPKTPPRTADVVARSWRTSRAEGAGEAAGLLAARLVIGVLREELSLPPSFPDRDLGPTTPSAQEFPPNVRVARDTTGAPNSQAGRVGKRCATRPDLLIRKTVRDASRLLDGRAVIDRNHLSLGSGCLGVMATRNSTPALRTLARRTAGHRKGRYRARPGFRQAAGTSVTLDHAFTTNRTRRSRQSLRPRPVADREDHCYAARSPFHPRRPHLFPIPRSRHGPYASHLQPRQVARPGNRQRSRQFPSHSPSPRERHPAPVIRPLHLRCRPPRRDWPHDRRMEEV